MINSESTYITTEELARLLRVHRTTIVRWIKAGIIPAERIGSKTIRVRKGLYEISEDVLPKINGQGLTLR